MILSIHDDINHRKGGHCGETCPVPDTGAGIQYLHYLTRILGPDQSLTQACPVLDTGYLIQGRELQL